MDKGRSVFFMFYIICLSEANDLEFELTHSSQIIIGETFTLNCTFSKHEPVQVLKFRRNGIELCLITTDNSSGSCNTSKYIEPEYQYKCDTTLNKFYLTIPGSHVVERLHNSTWKCDHPLGGGFSNNVTLFVNVPITGVILNPNDTSNVTAQENVPHLLTCETSPIRPGGKIYWYLNGINVTSLAVPNQDINTNNRIISTSVFNYTWNRTDNGKSVWCNASNLNGYLQVKSNVKQIDVQYGPLYNILSPPRKTYFIKENDIMTVITCRSDCKPECNNIWTGPGINAVENNLILNHIKRQQTGKFTCTSRNVVDSYETLINIIVQYAPEIHNINVSSGNDPIAEHTHVILSCSAEGQPVPLITWHFKHSSGSTILLNTNGTGHSTHDIVRSECENTGTYTCEANNTVFPLSVKTAFLNVTCVPRLNVSCSTNTSIEITNNNDASVHVCWISNPAPEVTWRLISDNSTMQNYVHKITPILYKSILQTKFVSAATFVYEVIARNTYGYSEPISYTLIVNYTALPGGSAPIKPSDRLVTIAIIAGSAFALLVICIVIALFLKCRTQKTGDKGDQAISSRSKRGQSSDFLLDDQIDQTNKGRNAECRDNDVPLYAEVQKKKSETCQTQQNSSSLYSVVIKPKSTAHKEHSMPKSLEIMKESSAVSEKNNSGLVYVEVSFDNIKTGKKFEIREQAERTEYGEIDFTKKAEPLPSDDQEQSPDNFRY